MQAKTQIPREGPLALSPQNSQVGTLTSCTVTTLHQGSPPPWGRNCCRGSLQGGSQTLHPLACSQVLCLLNSGARTSSDLTWCLRNKASGTRYSGCPPLTRVPAREPVSIGKKKRNHKNLGGKVLQQGMAYFKDSTLAKALREERCKAERMWVS